MSAVKLFTAGVDVSNANVSLFVESVFWQYGKGEFGKWIELVLRKQVEGRWRDFPMQSMLPALRPLIFGLFGKLEGTELGHVSVVKIDAGQTLLRKWPAEELGAMLVLESSDQFALTSGQTPQLALPGQLFLITDGEVLLYNAQAGTSATVLEFSFSVSDFKFAPGPND